MQNSLFLAKLLGPYCMIVALGIMLNLKLYQKMMEDFLKNTALLYLGGALALIIGLLIVLVHNVWAANWTVIITIFGWMGIAKGTWLIIFPGKVGQLTAIYQKKTTLLLVHVFIVLIIGAVLTVSGYCGG